MSIFSTKDPVAEENITRQKVELILNRQAEILHQLIATNKVLDELAKVVRTMATDKTVAKSATQLSFKPLNDEPYVRKLGKTDIARLKKLLSTVGNSWQSTENICVICDCSRKNVENLVYTVKHYDNPYEVETMKLEGLPKMFRFKEVS